MNFRLRLTLANDAGEEFFGRGLCELLDGIDALGSIQAAARAMNLSYVKALHILQRLERELGFPLVLRHRGGANRGGATLTPAAHAFLAAYRTLESSLQTAATSLFPPFAQTCRSLLPSSPLSTSPSPPGRPAASGRLPPAAATAPSPADCFR